MGLLYGPNGLLSMNNETFNPNTEGSTVTSSAAPTAPVSFHQSPASTAFALPGGLPGAPLASLPGLGIPSAGKFAGGSLAGLPPLGVSSPGMGHGLTGAMAVLSDTIRTSPGSDTPLNDMNSDETSYIPGKQNK